MSLRRLHALFAAFLLASCTAPETFRFERPAVDAWTALPLRLESGRPHVDVEVNGKRFPVLFDLGAGGTVWLDPDVAKAAGARFTGESSTWLDAFGIEQSSRRYVLDAVRAGDFVLRDLEGRELPPVPEPLGGILGWRLLQRFRVLIDFPGRRVVLATGGALPPDVHPELWTRVPFRATSSGIVTDAVADGLPLELVWDTGATRSILKPGRVDPERCGKEAFPTFYAETLRLAGHDFGPLAFVVLDIQEPPGDGLVGQPFFEAHRVLIDWESRELSIEHPAR
ncbi:MAG: aspartyl protease family protein [Planctomycetes bacterium]|nr:aspartyl protease family protein [Planctomycetota bacterium]